MEKATNILPSDGYLLIVEDHKIMSHNYREKLEQQGYEVCQAFNLAEAYSFVEQKLPRCILLDIMLPDGSGLDFLRELRKKSNVPVLILTGLDTDNDVINGFRLGADDYLPKPCNLNVLVVRAEALMRRYALMPDTLVVGSIKIDVAASKVHFNGKEVVLPNKELSLLEQFIQNQGKILTAGYLYEKVWGQKMMGVDNSLKVAISKLRKKIAGSGYIITSSRGEGYCFESE